MNEYCSKLNQYGLLWLTRSDLIIVLHSRRMFVWVMFSLRLCVNVLDFYNYEYNLCWDWLLKMACEGLDTTFIGFSISIFLCACLCYVCILFFVLGVGVVGRFFFRQAWARNVWVGVQIVSVPPIPIFQYFRHKDSHQKVVMSAIS